VIVNPTVWAWFDEGAIEGALMGEGRFFLPEHTYRDHDRVLVIDQLFDWAKLRHREHDASMTVENLVAQYAARGEILHAARLILTYLIVEDDRGDTIGVDRQRVAISLAMGIEQHPSLLPTDEATRTIVLALADRMPELKRLLKLSVVRTASDPERE
jgi:hypothetical protein